MKKAKTAEQELLWECLDASYIKYVVLTMERNWGWSHDKAFAAILDLEARSLCAFDRIDQEDTKETTPRLTVRLSELSLEDVWEDWSLFIVPTKLTRSRLAEVGGMEGFFDREETDG